MEELGQVVTLLVLAVPVAWAAWTVTHEELFREVQQFCTDRSKTCRWAIQRKFFYLFTCEYCFSHWCALAVVALFQFRLVFDDWRGYVVSFPALVWIANIYMNLYHRVRVDIRKERAIADRAEEESGKSRAA
jgi:hypothetical protein